jgi:hypothetical protein
MHKTLFLGLAAAVAMQAAAAQASVLTLDLTADNGFSAYLSTSDSVLGDLIGSGGDWTSTFHFTADLTAPSDYYLHVVATNSGGPDGYIGAFSLSDATYAFANGTQSLVTNATDWRAAPHQAIWAAPSGTPQDEGPNGVAPWGPRANIAANAHWLWGPNGEDTNGVADFSTRISFGNQSSGAPEPGAWVLLITGFSLAGAMLRRRVRTA